MSKFVIVRRGMPGRCLVVACLTLSGVGLTLLAAQNPPKEPKRAPAQAGTGIEATLQQLSWISGAWDGKGLGGTVEEHWTKPSGDSMVGMFRLVGANGKMIVSELLLIEQRGKHVVYSFRHFGPGHNPWEDLDKPLVFDLIRLSPTEAIFESSVQTDPKRLTYTRKDDELSVRVQGETDGALGDGFTLSMKQTKLGA
jgi:hypothetical protein